MAARSVFADPSYLEDIRSLRARGLTYAEVATALGMSRATLFRILAQARR